MYGTPDCHALWCRCNEPRWRLEKVHHIVEEMKRVLPEIEVKLRSVAGAVRVRLEAEQLRLADHLW